MQKLAKRIERTMDLLFYRIDRHSEDGSKPLNLGMWLHYFSFDVLGEVAFGKRFGFLDSGTDVENVIRTVSEVQRYNAIIGHIPFMDRWLRHNPLWKFVPFVDNRPPLTARVAWNNVVARQHRRRSDIREDLLAHLLKGADANPDKFDNGDVFAVLHGAM